LDTPRPAAGRRRERQAQRDEAEQEYKGFDPFA
jgi:GTP-binding protein